jgi:serine/threonine protein kinase
MGATYLADQLEIERPVAIKVVHSALAAQQPEVLERFKREARVLAQIRHPNVVQLYTVGQTDDGLPFFAMEFVPGQNLATELARLGALPLPRVLRIAEQITSALSEAHRVGVIHRDLKPANIMLSVNAHGDEAVKVVDFGIAKSLTTTDPLTVTGAFFGSPQYVAPEQVRAQAVDARTDLYAFGLVLYEMLTGTSAFTGGSAYDLLAQQVMETPPAPSTKRLGLPPALDALVLRCIQKQPEQRYPDAAAVRRELLQMQADTSQPAPNTPWAFERTAPAPSIPSEPEPQVSAPPRSKRGWWEHPALRAWLVVSIVLVINLGRFASSHSDRLTRAVMRHVDWGSSAAHTPASSSAGSASPNITRPVVEYCLNQLHTRAADSYTRYASWAGFDEHIRDPKAALGLYKVADLENCLTALDDETSAERAAPPLSAAAKEFARSLQELSPLTIEADRYYEQKDYEDDHMARGQHMHSGLLRAFTSFLAAASRLQDLATQHVQRSEQALLRDLDPEQCEAAALRVGLTSQALLSSANRPFEQIWEIDRRRYANALGDLDAAVQAAEQRCSDASAAWLSATPAAGQKLLGEAKQFRRRLEAHKLFTPSELRRLASTGAWVVSASPASLVKHAGEVATNLNHAQLLRDAGLAEVVPIVARSQPQ